MTSAFGIDHGTFSKKRGEEFNPASTYERYSAEKKRRRLAAESGAYGGGAALAGAAGTAAAHAKFAGTRTGQGLLTGAEKKYGVNHPLTPHIRSAKKIGVYAAHNKGKMTGAVIGGSAIAGGLGVLQRFRHNEEIGVSQGIGRIKAGTTYASDQKKIAKGLSPVTTAASLADVNWNNPAIKRSLEFTNKYKKHIAIGAGSATAGGTGVGFAVGVRNRRKAAQQLRRGQ